ncbi:MAG: PilZ domain-containing protein [Pseudomonadota bacterium]
MEDSDVEIVREPGAVSRIFEQMLERRKALSIVQHGHRCDAWVVKASTSRLILAKRDKAAKFTASPVEFQFRCVLGRNIVGKSLILRFNEEYLEVELPAEIMIIQRRHAYRVVPTGDSVAIFQTVGKWILSGRIEDLSSKGVLIRLPQATPVVVPWEIRAVCLQLNHAVPASEFVPSGTVESFQVRLEWATIVRKADNGTTKLATYGVSFEPTPAVERQLAQIIFCFERAARLKGLSP